MNIVSSEQTKRDMHAMSVTATWDLRLRPNCPDTRRPTTRTLPSPATCATREWCGRSTCSPTSSRTAATRHSSASLSPVKSALPVGRCCWITLGKCTSAGRRECPPYSALYQIVLKGIFYNYGVVILNGATFSILSCHINFRFFLFQSLVNQQGGLQYFFVVFLVGVFHARPFFFSFMTTFF